MNFWLCEGKLRASRLDFGSSMGRGALNAWRDRRVGKRTKKRCIFRLEGKRSSTFRFQVICSCGIFIRLIDM